MSLLTRSWTMRSRRVALENSAHGVSNSDTSRESLAYELHRT